MTSDVGDLRNDQLRQSVERFRETAGVWLATRMAVAWLSVWCFVWGSAVLVLRVGVGLDRRPLLVGLGGVASVILWAAVLARRRLPNRSTIQALLDARNECGGLAMAAEELDPGQWTQQLPPDSQPQLTWRGGRKTLILVLAIVFLLGSFLAPKDALSRVLHRPLDVSGDLAEQAAQIETLEEEDIIDDEQAAELTEKLDRIEADSDGADPAKTWEAIDHMRQSLAALAEEAAEEILTDSETLCDAESLAKAMDLAAEQLDENAMAEAMEELAEMVEQAAEESDSLDQALSESAAAAAQAKALSPEQLRQLAEQLSQCRQGMATTMQRLCESGLLDPQQLAQLAQAGQCDIQQLAEYLESLNEALAEGQGQGNGLAMGEDVSALIEEWLAECQGDQPGRGGVSRGRADAAMTWRDPAGYEGTEFQEQTLPPAAMADLDSSRLTGVSTGAPDVDTTDGSSSGGALGASAAGGGSAHTVTVLPRHKAAVERYFEHDESP